MPPRRMSKEEIEAGLRKAPELLEWARGEYGEEGKNKSVPELAQAVFEHQNRAVPPRGGGSFVDALRYLRGYLSCIDGNAVLAPRAAASAARARSSVHDPEFQRQRKEFEQNVDSLNNIAKMRLTPGHMQALRASATQLSERHTEMRARFGYNNDKALETIKKIIDPGFPPESKSPNPKVPTTNVGVS